MAIRTSLWFGFSVAFLSACAGDSDASRRLMPGAEQVAATTTADSGSLRASAVEPLAKERELLADVLAMPLLPGAPAFEARRAELMSRAKGEPVVFVRAPSLPTPSRGKLGLHPDVELQAYLGTKQHYDAVRRTLQRHAGQYARLRQMLLREGYLYSEDPDRAFALLSQVGPHHLFGEEQIWIHRGEQVMQAKREGARYVFTDGPYAGQKATLMHLDRVGTGTVPKPLHRDLRSLKYRLHFDEARVERITDEYLVLGLRYGDDWVISVVRSEGGHLELEAELIAPEIASRVNAARAQNAQRQSSMQSLRDAIADQVAERLPFDEPKTEIGQEDGTLRNLWRYAYLAGQTHYEHNDDQYSVFTAQGAPFVPQVCIDFVVDTFERASGTWWNSKSATPMRRVGGIDLREFGRTELRRTDFFVSFAREHDQWFDVLEFSPPERIAMGNKSRFFEEISRRVDDFQVGDVVLIRGYTPWDDQKPHSHVFMIYEADPITRVPIVIAGNAGPANLWSWETEARRTPLRTVHYRVRPRQQWLNDALLAPLAPNTPPGLLPRGTNKAS